MKWKLSANGYYATSGKYTISWSHDKKVFILYDGGKFLECGSKSKCLESIK